MCQKKCSFPLQVLYNYLLVVMLPRCLVVVCDVTATLPANTSQ